MSDLRRRLDKLEKHVQPSTTDAQALQAICEGDWERYFAITGEPIPEDFDVDPREQPDYHRRMIDSTTPNGDDPHANDDEPEDDGPDGPVCV